MHPFRDPNREYLDSLYLWWGRVNNSVFLKIGRTSCLKLIRKNLSDQEYAERLFEKAVGRAEDYASGMFSGMVSMKAEVYSFYQPGSSVLANNEKKIHRIMRDAGFELAHGNECYYLNNAEEVEFAFKLIGQHKDEEAHLLVNVDEMEYDSGSILFKEPQTVH